MDPCSNFCAFMQDVRSPGAIVRVTSKATGAVRWISVEEFESDHIEILLHSTVRLFRQKGPTQ